MQALHKLGALSDWLSAISFYVHTQYVSRLNLSTPRYETYHHGIGCHTIIYAKLLRMHM